MADTLSGLQSAADALNIYIQNVQENIHIMNKAVEQCVDNMGSDNYSMKAAERLQNSLISLNQALQEAIDLRSKILTLISEIEGSENILN